jgi:hypothetical protein
MRITKTVRIDQIQDVFLKEHSEYNLSGITRTAINDIMANHKEIDFDRRE